MGATKDKINGIVLVFCGAIAGLTGLYFWSCDAFGITLVLVIVVCVMLRLLR